MSDVAPRTPCPDAESLAAYVDGRTGAADRAAMERHLVECGECRDLIGAAAELAGESAATATATAPPRRRAVRWYVAGAGLVAAAAALILVVRMQRPDASHTAPEIAELVAAAGSSRLVEPRLTGGFAYGPPPSPMRSGNASMLNPDLQIAAAQIQKKLATRRDAASLHAAGVAELLQARPDRAIEYLREAAMLSESLAQMHSDLAAAYLVRARTLDAPDDAVRALDAAERAVTLTPRLAEAHFNRALALEALSLRDRARSAWEEYLRLEPQSPWADEARRHLAALDRTGDWRQLEPQFHDALGEKTVPR